MSTAAKPSWEPVWDNIFATRSWGSYPSENLIRFIAKNYYGAADRKKVKILDLGAGSGANTHYLAREGFDTYAIDGSAVAIDIIRERLAKDNLSATLFVGDVSNVPVEDGSLDCIVDVNCIMCNTFETSQEIIRNAVKKLKTGGRFYSMCGKAGTWGDGLGQKIAEDTYLDAPDGPYAHMGTVRFLRRENVEKLYAPLADLEINHSGFTRENGNKEITFWMISGVKK